MNKIDELRFMMKSISIYRDVMDDKVMKDLCALYSGNFSSAEEAAETYGRLFYALCKSESSGNLADYVYDKVIFSENLFTLECAKGKFSTLSETVLKAASNDISTLFHVSKLPSSQLKDHLSTLFPSYRALFERLPDYITESQRVALANWGVSLHGLSEYYRKNGYGHFGRHRAFSLEIEHGTPNLIPVVNPDPIRLADLKDYKDQQQIIQDNTVALLKGLKANNILLYGDSGTGKSSTVKAMVNEYATQGLRLIEVSKQNIIYIGKIIDMLADIPLKFIIFIDDLTFTDGDNNYAAMKAVLEGSYNKIADNMVIYATSNRRHLVQETFQARQGDEIHIADTIDELTSLSDRFGLTVTFMSPGFDTYMNIIRGMLKDAGMTVSDDEWLRVRANRWSIEKCSMAPRSARQFVDYLIAKLKNN